MDRKFREAVVATLAFLGLLWLIGIADWLLGLDLYRLGVFPQTLHGSVGIVTSPLVHGSWTHLLSNSFALLLLLTTLLYGYPRAAVPALGIIYLGSGIGVWLFARESYHFGASGLTHGLMFFIFTAGILRRDKLSIALSLLVFFIYGSMIWSIFPQQPGISYESHFFGALTGVAAAFLLKNRDPRPPEKTYDWEDEDNEQPWPPGDNDEYR